jgi:hypothetical protein
VREASTREHQFLCVEHIFYALLHDQRIIEIVEACGGDVEELKHELLGYLERFLEKNAPLSNPPKQTPAVERVLQRAIVHMRSAGKDQILPEDVLVAIMAEDDTRPVIVDGVGDMGWPIINMEHYVGEGYRNGQLGVLPEFGGTPRPDRPYGETECVWPMDNSWQGFAWMSTCTRIRRLKGNADIRNYVLNNAWSNYVPGQSAELQHLEKLIKKMQWTLEPPFSAAICPALEDMWNHPLIKLMQKCFNPVAVCDVKFDEANKRSNASGDWPVFTPTLNAGAMETRKLAIFNDEFSGEEVSVTWELRLEGATGHLIAQGQFAILIPLGEHRYRHISFTVPREPCELALVLRAHKNGIKRFDDDLIRFAVVPVNAR